MLLGSIKRCVNCKQDNYIRAGIDNCPNCGERFDDFVSNKAPAGWVKMENYEISRRSVDKMIQAGELTEKDLR